MKEFYRRCLPHWQPPQGTYFITYRLAGSIPKAVYARIREEYLAEVAAAREEVYGHVYRDSVLGMTERVPELRSGFISGDAASVAELRSGFISEEAERSSATRTRSGLPGEEAERSSATHTRSGLPGEEAERSSATRARSATRSATPLSPEIRQQLASLLKQKRYDAQKRQFKSWDDFLDTNLNEPHYLKNPDVAEMNMKAIQFYDGKQYQLLAACIMSNHVHLLFHLLPNADQLSKVLQDLKRYTSVHSNRILGREGTFWERESYDHLVRDGEFDRILAYVVNNPLKAGLVKHWEDYSWTFCCDSLR